jgi:hypothetical protein
VKFDPSQAAVGANVMGVENDRKRKRVEPQCAARPSGVDPACWCLTPHGFGLPAGIMFPVDRRELARIASASA